MNTPVPYNSRGSSVARSGAPGLRRDLARVERRMLVRTANVQAEENVQAEKLHAIDHLAREAMTGQAMLQRWGSTLTAGDPFVSEDMKLYLDIAKLAKAEILSDTVETFCRESRR
jgi:hypothetical protein